MTSYEMVDRNEEAKMWIILCKYKINGVLYMNVVFWWKYAIHLEKKNVWLVLKCGCCTDKHDVTC